MVNPNPFVSIVVTFCDKDYQYVEPLIESFEQYVNVPYEVVLIDNREVYKNEPITIKWPIYTQGYNTYQFEARRFSIRFCKGQYIWFFDVDDQVMPINQDLTQHLKEDIVAFNFTIKGIVISLPDSFVRRRELFGNSRFNRLTKEEILQVSNGDMWETLGCTLWNKWIKRDLLQKIVPLIPAHEKIIASEDVLWNALAVYYSKNIQYCSDLCYIYNEYNAQGYSPTMTYERFKHIIHGRKRARELFEQLIDTPDAYDDNVFGVAYFYTKLLTSDRQEDCFKLILENFDKESMIKAKEYSWITGLKPKHKKKLFALIDKYCSTTNQ